MARRKRPSFRWVKWACLLATSVVWGLCIVSEDIRIEYRWGARYIGLVEFGINVGTYSSAAMQEGPPGLHTERQSGMDMSRVTISGPGWWFTTIDLVWLFLLLPLVTLGLFIHALWRWRRVPPGHCRHCRYDLAGNSTGVCPECGRGSSGAARP